ncbi:MAG: LAGLIDADG family homing endonuclease [bacterium]|nr:LAGLIDADG family homing endonuclease [bacterium]
MIHKLTQEEQNQVCQLYKNEIKIDQIANQFNIENPTVYNILKYNNIKTDRRDRILTPKETSEILNKYKNGETLFDLAKEYNTFWKKLTTLLKNSDIKIRSSRKYSVNHNYFEKIDTEEKAYFLGILYADGCNINTSNRGTIKLSLQEPDKYIVEEFAKCIKYTGKIYISPRNSWKKTLQNQYYVAINSRKLSNDLLNIGMTPRKSLTLEFPKLNKNLIPAFINGYFDGDGCMCNSKTPFNKIRGRISILSSNTFCNYLQQTLLKQYKIESIVRKATNSKIWILTISREKSILLFFNTIYKNRKFFMKRKYQKFIEYMSSRNIYPTI